MIKAFVFGISAAATLLYLRFLWVLFQQWQDRGSRADDHQRIDSVVVLAAIIFFSIAFLSWFL